MEKDKKSKEVESLKINIGWFQLVQELSVAKNKNKIKN